MLRQLMKKTANHSQHNDRYTIEHSTYHLLTIINDIPDFSKPGAGKLILEKAPFNISNKHPYSSRLPVTVMVVDDNPASLQLTGALLEKLVEHSVLCSDGKSAIEYAQYHHLDLILMNAQLSDIEGDQATRMIRSISRHASVPVIAVAAHLPQSAPDQLTQSGMSESLAHPLSELKLSQLLVRYTSDVISEVTLSPSLDWRLALRQAADEPKLAKELLQMLIDSLPEFETLIEKNITENNSTELHKVIHKLHGSAACSGVPRMKTLCQRLEHGLLTNTTLADLEPELLELLDEIHNVTSLASSLLSQPEGDLLSGRLSEY